MPLLNRRVYTGFGSKQIWGDGELDGIGAIIIK